MHRPEKRGAVIRSRRPKQTVQARTAPVWDPEAKLYKFWVLGIDDTFWQSEDGLQWTPGPRPNVPVTMAVYDPVGPDPARRFKAPLLNRGFAVSPDGSQWTKLDQTGIQSSDQGNFSYDPREGLFIHTIKRGGKYGRSVAVATSRDFKNWTDYGIVFQADERDQELGVKNIEARLADATLQQTLYNDPDVYNVDVYNMGVFRYEDLYIGLPALYHATGPVPNYPNTVGFQLVQLACSRDLKHWRRLGDRQPFIGPSRLESGAYDLTQILPPSAGVVHGDELWFYYTGLKYRGNFTYVGTYPHGRTELMPGRDRDGGAICLAVLRRDGFVSLDAGDQEGFIATKPFAVPAGKLFVNTNARNGSLRVDVIDEQDQVVASSAPVTADLPRSEIKWQQGDLAALKGRALSLRVTLQQASLYAYWFED
ncbi:MAG: hypothetical protein ACC645_21295 [Pirellulales bacterium]